MHFLRGRATKSSTTRHCPPASAKGPVPVPPSQAPTYRRGIAPFRPCGPGPAGVGSPPPPARPPRNFSLRFPRAGRSNVAGAVTAARGRIAPRWPGGLRPMPARARLRRPRVGPGRPEDRNAHACVRAFTRARTNASTLAHRRGRRDAEDSKMGNKIQKWATKPKNGRRNHLPRATAPRGLSRSLRARPLHFGAISHRFGLARHGSGPGWARLGMGFASGPTARPPPRICGSISLVRRSL